MEDKNLKKEGKKMEDKNLLKDKVIDCEIEPEKNEVIEVKERNLPVPHDRVESIIKLAEQSERLMGALKKIKRQVLSLTNENDWSDLNGQPYLEGSGSQKIARFFGISWEFIGEPQRISLEEGHYRYDVKMRFWKDRDSIEVIGSRSSNDAFFTTRYEWDKEKKEKVKKILSASEIDGGNVLKSAITNAMQGILSFLGMRKLTWEDLKAGGLDVDKIMKEKSVRYGQKSQPKTGSEPIPPKEVKTSPLKADDNPIPIRTEIPPKEDKATNKQIEAIGNLLNDDLEKVTEKLFMVRIKDLNYLTKREASIIISYLRSNGKN